MSNYHFSWRRIVLGALLLLSFGTPALAVSDGISTLLQVAIANSEKARDEAQAAADQQRELVRKKKLLRAQEDQLMKEDELLSSRLDANARLLAKVAADLRQLDQQIKADCH